MLQSVLDGVWFTPRDVGGAQGMHDLDLADGCTFAVEVTSDKSQADTAFQSQVERINPLPAPGLPHSWHVLITSPGEDHTDQTAAGRRSKSLKNDLPSLLSQVESDEIFAEVKHVSPYRRRGESEVVSRLRGLGVRSASPLEDDTGETRIVLGQAALSGAVGPGALVDAVREHLPRKRANTNQHAHSTWTHNRVPLRPTLPDLGNETRTVSCHTCVTYAWPVSVIAECVRNTGLANESDCDEAYAGSGKLGGPAVRTQAVGAAGRAGAVGLTVATSACGHARGGPARRCHRHRRRFR